MIEHYVQNILTPWLHSRRLPAPAVLRVADDVRDRLCSVLSRWGEVDYRATLLMPTREEAVFYEPQAAPLDVRSLVVLCLRDSLVEDWCSVASGRDTPLTEADVRDLTMTAIAYFSGPADLAGAASGRPNQDVFGALPARYPAAWRALSVLAALPPGLAGVEYDPVAPRRPPLPLSSRDSPLTKPLRVQVELSGMSPLIDPGLALFLQHLAQNRLDCFFSCNFKMITRNLDKLLSIIEFVLACGKPLVTINYYLSNGLVLRRRRLWRPAHGQYEPEAQLLDHRLPHGVTSQHRAVLRTLQERTRSAVSRQA